MATAKIATGYVEIKTEVDKLRRDLRLAKDRMDDAATQMERRQKTLTTRFKTGWASITASVFSYRSAMLAAAGAVGLGYFIKRSLEATDAVGKVADKIGLSTARLQEYQYAAKLSGIEQTQVNMGLQRFIRRVAEAAAGQGELKDTLELYNIKVKDSAGNTRDVNAVLGDLAEVMKNSESKAERLRIAFKAFDSEGVAMVNMLKDGREGLKVMTDEANALGLVMDEKLIREATRASDEIDKLTSVLSMQFKVAAAELAPYIADIAEHMIEWVKANKDFLTQDVPTQLKSWTNEAKGFWEIIKKFPDAVTAMLAPFSPEHYGKLFDLPKLEPEKLEPETLPLMPEIEPLALPEVKGPEAAEFPLIPYADEAAVDEAIMAAEEAMDKFAELDERRLEAQAETYQREFDLQVEKYNRQMELITENEEALTEIKQRAENDRLRNALAADKRLAQLQVATGRAKLQLAKSLAVAVLQLAGVEGKELFMAMKAADIAMAIISAHMAAARALAEHPFPASLAIAAQVQTMGYVQAAMIAAQGIGQMAVSSGGGLGGGTYTSPTITAPAYSPVAEIPEKEEEKGVINIYFQGDVLADDQYLETLAEKLSELVEDKEIRLISSEAKYAEELK